MTRSLLFSTMLAVSVFVGDWLCAQVHGQDCACGGGTSMAAGSYSGAVTGCCDGCGVDVGSCTSCYDETCGTCGNLRRLGRGYWTRLGCTSSCSAPDCVDGTCGLSSCNFGHACDLFSRFSSRAECGSGLFGCGLFGGCATCSGPGAGDPSGATVKHCGMPSPAYPVPYSVPAYVGITHLTYPPMMPHHSLPHYRGTYSYRHDEGLSRTTVHWRKTHVINAAARLHHIIELPR